MQAVILAGGRGERLGPLTDTLPKPMLPINEKPFLQYQLELLRKYEIKEILLCVGYLWEVIKDFFGNGSRFGVNIQYSVEKQLLDTGGALKNARKYLQNNFMLLNGDTYLSINYHDFIRHFEATDKMALLAVYDNRKKIAPYNIGIDEHNLVIDYNKQQEKKDMKYVDAGAIILKRVVLSLMPETKVISLEEVVYPKLIAMKQLQAYPISQRYYDIGTLKRLKLARKVLR